MDVDNVSWYFMTFHRTGLLIGPALESDVWKNDDENETTRAALFFSLIKTTQDLCQDVYRFPIVLYFWFRLR